MTYRDDTNIKLIPKLANVDSFKFKLWLYPLATSPLSSIKAKITLSNIIESNSYPYSMF